MKKILKQSFFNRPTLVVACELLGKYMVRRINGKNLALMITEVEAYDGPLDHASHAFRGRTPRTNVMFGPAGVWYVYFTYGIHWMANIVTGPKNYPAAILIRAGYGIRGKDQKIHIKGPALVARYLGVDRTQNEKPATKKAGLWIEDRGVIVKPKQMIPTKRVGVDYAGRIWKNKLYNFRYIG
jgi:DNA-3-methyladenine glycosylase